MKGVAKQNGCCTIARATVKTCEHLALRKVEEKFALRGTKYSFVVNLNSPFFGAGAVARAAENKMQMSPVQICFLSKPFISLE